MHNILNKAYIKFTVDTLELYKSYQIANDITLKQGDHTLYWFTIKPSSPSRRWDHFQLELKKYVCPFYYDLCHGLIGKHYNRPNKKHLKPFLYATPDYENSNQVSPLIVNSFNHIHGIICIRNDQIIVFETLLNEFKNNYIYSNYIEDIRSIIINKVDHVYTDDIGYKVYINKNTTRKFNNINNGIFLPADKIFHTFIGKNNSLQIEFTKNKCVPSSSKFSFDS